MKRVGFLQRVVTERREPQHVEKHKTKKKRRRAGFALGRRPRQLSRDAGTCLLLVEEIRSKRSHLGLAVKERSQLQMLQKVGKGEFMCL